MGDDINDKIRNRKNWLIVGVVSALTSLIVYKVAITDFGPALQQFRFSDLLALLLSLFAVGLSAAFYFKASEHAARFYDNTYKFTQETSEILGRMEAGFGERLRHLDEGYVGLATKFDSMPAITTEIESAEEGIEEENTKLKRQLEERKLVIADLAHRAKMSSEERDHVIADIEERDGRITELRQEIFMLRERLAIAERQAKVHMEYVPNKLVAVLRPLLNGKLGYLLRRGASTQRVRGEFVKARDQLPAAALVSMAALKWLADDGELTDAGYVALRTLSRESNGDEDAYPSSAALPPLRARGKGSVGGG